MTAGKAIRIHMLLIIGSILLCLTSCQLRTIHARQETSGQQIMRTMKESIAEDSKFNKPKTPIASKYRHRRPLPSLSHYLNPTKEMEPRFDVAANNTPAKDFFVGLVTGTPYNIIVDPHIDGLITLNLKNVTLRQTLEAVQDLYGYQFHYNSYGYEISRPSLESRLFHINYLDIQRSGRSYTQLTTGQVSNKIGTVSTGGSSSNTLQSTASTSTGLGTISSIETRSEINFWKDLEKSVQGIIGTGEGKNVSVNSQTGLLSVRAFPNELKNVNRFVNNLQSSLNRQVILEAKILEIQLDDSYQAGIDWSILQNPALNPAGDAGIGQGGNSEVTNTTLKDLSGIFALKIKGNFKALINLLQTQGNVQVLSSPHISTVNNQKAVIKVGQDEFFVTGVSTSNTLIGTNTLPSQDVSLTPFFSGITLDVTPEISSDNSVILHIHPSVSQVTEQTKNIGLGSTAAGTNNTLSLPLAFSTIRESDNIVRAKNGQVIVIGGLMQNNMQEVIASTPWAGKIPFFGTFFRRTQQQSTKSELVILLRPIVATNQHVTDELKDELQAFRSVHHPFHTGSLPHLFGNEAERAPE